MRRCVARIPFDGASIFPFGFRVSTQLEQDVGEIAVRHGGIWVETRNGAIGLLRRDKIPGMGREGGDGLMRRNMVGFEFDGTLKCREGVVKLALTLEAFTEVVVKRPNILNGKGGADMAFGLLERIPLGVKHAEQMHGIGMAWGNGQRGAITSFGPCQISSLMMCAGSDELLFGCIYRRLRGGVRVPQRHVEWELLAVWTITFCRRWDIPRLSSYPHG